MLLLVRMRERELIEQIRRAAASSAPRGSALRLGIGDDCAIVEPPRGHQVIVTTDFCLEGVHFRRDLHSPRSAGHRCLARGLSDIAAMGGRPLAAFLSLALPPDTSRGWIDAFLGGLLRLARAHGVPLAGGDTASSPNGIAADIAVLGSLPRGRALTRAGAKPGDRIYVSGELGASAAVLRRLLSGSRSRASTNDRHFFPQPRLKLGQELLRRRLATACIDLSDGLSTDLDHICRASGVGAALELKRLPVAPGARKQKDALSLALHGGEDYELLFTAPPNRKIPSMIAGISVTQIGEMVAMPKPMIAGRDQQGTTRVIEPGGWEHFRKE